MRTLILFVALLGLTESASAQAELSRSDLFSQQPGRYQIVTSPHNVRDTFLLDTATGRVWRLVKYTDIEDQPTAWDEMPKFGQGVSFFETMTRFGWKFAEEKKPVAAAPTPLAPALNIKPRAQN